MSKHYSAQKYLNFIHVKHHNMLSCFTMQSITFKDSTDVPRETEMKDMCTYT